MKQSKLVLGVVTAVVTLGTLAFAVSPAGAKPANPSPITICDAYGDGTGASGGTEKIDVIGEVKAVTVSAPSGYVIDFYCVKAGTATVIVQVDPPEATVQIAAPNGKGVSHYSVHYIDEYNS